MTLERHRSKLIPDIAFDLGGRMVVTDGDGTFPLSQGKRRERLPDFKDENVNDLLDKSDLQSYRSYDPKRERKFKPRENRFEKEVNNINTTLSSGGSKSLQRKLKRYRNSRDESKYEIDGTPKFGSLNLTGTMSDRGRSRRPKSHPVGNAYGGSLNRKKVKQTLSIGTIKRATKPANDEVYSKESKNAYVNGGVILDDIPETLDIKNKKFAEEKLPGVFFLLDGLLMLILAVVKLLLSWWTSYWAPLWTSVLIICFGVTGILHRGDYFTKWKNCAYVTLGFLSLLSAFACCGLLLWVTAPMLAQFAAVVPTEVIAKNVNQTNQGRSLVADLPVTTAVPLTFGFDLAILILCLASLYSLTASQIALSNHWDAVYIVTGDCDHRGNPRVFNPLEQSIIGVATTIIGIFAMMFTQSELFAYGTPAIAGAMVILAGMVGFCYGKRPDKLAVATLSALTEVAALMACGVSTIFLTLALVHDAQVATSSESSSSAVTSISALKASQGQSIAALVFIGLYFLTMICNVIFASGVLFRVCRKSCCTCIEENFLLNDSRF